MTDSSPITPGDTTPAPSGRGMASLGQALGETLHILRGDACREFLGRGTGHCGRPATNGLCPLHADERAAFYTTPKGR